MKQTMNPQKIKRYRMPVSVKFPKGHPRAGEETHFIEKINNAIGDTESCKVVIHTCNGDLDIWPKIHTCRGKYDRWVKIMAEVQAGKAVLELYYWDGQPYGKGVKQIVFQTLDKNSGCGVQKLFLNLDERFDMYAAIDEYYICLNALSENDGLLFKDFKAWFKGADLSEPMAIIHFTRFRY